MKRGWSASTGAAAHASGSRATSSSQPTSRPATQGMSRPRRRHTITCSTDGEAATASSAVSLERHELTAAVEAVHRHEGLRLAVLEARRDRLGAEPGEARHRDRAEPRHREERDRRLDRHREEDADPIAPADPERPQPVREPADLAGQLRVGDGAGRAVVSLGDHGGRLAASRVEVPVHAVRREVQDAAVEPPRPRHSPREVDDAIVRSIPAHPEVPLDGGPVPRGVLPRPSLELRQRRDPVSAEEDCEPRLLRVLGRRAPHEVCAAARLHRSLPAREPLAPAAEVIVARSRRHTTGCRSPHSCLASTTSAMRTRGLCMIAFAGPPNPLHRLHEALRLGLRVELEVNHHVVRVVPRAEDLVAADS